MQSWNTTRASSVQSRYSWIPDFFPEIHSAEFYYPFPFGSYEISLEYIVLAIVRRATNALVIIHFSRERDPLSSNFSRASRILRSFFYTLPLPPSNRFSPLILPVFLFIKLLHRLVQFFTIIHIFSHVFFSPSKKILSLLSIHFLQFDNSYIIILVLFFSQNKFYRFFRFTSYTLIILIFSYTFYFFLKKILSFLSIHFLHFDNSHIIICSLLF